MDDIRVRPDVEWREVEGRIVAMDVRTADCVALNRTGTRLWSAVVEGTSVEQLATALVEAFGLEEEAARRDVDAFVEALRARDLLVS